MNLIKLWNEAGEARKVGDFKPVYVATDGWRGYYNAVATKKSKWEKLVKESNYITGDFEDAGEHAESKVKENLEAMEGVLKNLGYEMAVVFAPTSNVFSTGFDVFKRPQTI